MNKFLVVLFSLLLSYAEAQDLSYYLPQHLQYNASIPKPEEVIGHKVGEWHVTHDRLVSYMKALASAAPDRIQLKVSGYTYESRPQLLLIITSPSNHKKLEEIRKTHLQITDAAVSGTLNVENMPTVLWQGFSIHGNEASGANASMLTAYYLAAAQGKEIEELLENVVILLDPSFNPDGLNRFATWVNQHKSKNLVIDPNSREFNEVWPGGRFNHYWFDLNRDWLPAQHVESRNRLKWFHDWMPNILTDHHEMGSNASFFFQPGVPSRVNPLTPVKNQELTGKIAQFHAKYLDKIGSMYYTKEGFDDYYYGKGSTYPDVQGCIGILFEQASSRGHAQQTVNGLLRFSFTIRNQFTTTLSTLDAAKTMRMELLNYQRDFFKNVAAESKTFGTGAFLYGDEKDNYKTALFTEILLRHGIEVYKINNNLQAEGQFFQKENAYIVPLQQQQHRLIRSIFEKQLNYKDSLFYDVTAWTMPLAFGLPSAAIASATFNASMKGAPVTMAVFPEGKLTGPKSNYAYAFNWDAFLAPKLLYELQQLGVQAKVSAAPFETPLITGKHQFNYGTIIIPVAQQSMDADKLYTQLETLARKNAVEVFSLQTGLSTSGIDLGSNKIQNVAKPVVALLVGNGVSATDAGEVWHLMDQRFDIPVSHLEIPAFNRIDAAKYNTIIMVSGNYEALSKEKLKAWIQGGGNLIALEDAAKWCAQNGITTIEFKKETLSKDSGSAVVYADKENKEGAQQLTGAIFRATMDITHPLSYGYHVPYVDLFKQSRVFIEPGKNKYAYPLLYGDKPLQSGFVTKENYNNLKNAAAVVVSTVGNGRVISIADNPNFRAFWLGGTKLFMNAIFFGRNIEAGSGRAE